MRIATWNVNSARARADRVVEFVQRHSIDVLLMQETKCKDEQFPREQFQELGYDSAHHGLNQWNGVAILSRIGISDISTEFPGQPGGEARAIGATCGPLRCWSLYIPNGRAISAPHYHYKLHWLQELSHAVSDTLRHNPQLPLLLSGDFNIAPTDEDVWDRALFEGRTHVTEPERAALGKLLDSGLTDLCPQSGWTYWDYKGGRFHKDEGMRIDFHLGSSGLVRNVRHSMVDREEREGRGASDHAPLIVEVAL
ncbi:exodeoxyribonuclease III [Corynebacterium poyangense]|uniref:Exodeoxyribonuclease III n=1 Tax=Corynebacterium poyangense TaxID=2684405 RepID=A0A7H0SSK4_9CORY|nr:exodeoxyribonuclease III [Corynebacterium poyangense]MBZ8176520.1 exodeoxyribonuclease III [Corynebacterium poyangense]QNQ91529.1 exodeoxyribonuclease III [Corynebacterium poyangense]